MDLDYLYEFLTLAEHRNFHVAAENLGISQPSLTNHIKRLESELNASLFNRNTRNMELSECGHIFYPYAKNLTEMYASATQAVKTKRRTSDTVISVAMEPHYMVGELLRLFNRYKADHPNAVIEFFNAAEAAAYNLLRSGRCDLAITPQAALENPEFFSFTLREEHAVAVVRKDHPLAMREVLDIGDLVGENLFIPPARLILYKLLISAYRTAGLEMDACCMGITEDMGMLLAKQGLGIAIMSDYAAKKLADDSLSIIDIHPELKWYVNLLYANVHSSPDGKNLADYVQSALNEKISLPD